MRQSEILTINKAILKAEKYCSYQERCHFDVKQKLFEWGLEKDEKDKVLVHLIENDYLNEMRFAEVFVRGKFNIKKWGRQRLKAELKSRQISPYIIQKSISSLDENQYLQTFDELATKKANSIKDLPIQNQKRKLFDYLVYRGWEYHLIYNKINELIG